MTLSPKRLNFSEMWKLYRTIKKGLPEKSEEFLVYEVIKIMEGLDTQSFKQSLSVMYGKNFHNNKTPADFALLFIKGIKETGILSFSFFIKSFK